jgi:hypothetical protein
VSLTLSVADAADGTGVLAAVAGTLGAAVTVYAAGVADRTPFGPAGSRTGDGPLTLALPPRLYWLHAATAAAVSPVVGVAATDGLDKVPTRCRAAVAALIGAMDLTGLTRIYEQIYPDETGVTYPCVQITVEGAAETTGPNGTYAADEVGYPVRVAICDRLSQPPDHRKLPQYEAWRYAISRAFDGRFLDGVPESTRCQVEPYLIADPLLPQYAHYVSGLMVRCFCRVPRGVGV